MSLRASQELKVPAKLPGGAQLSLDIKGRKAVEITKSIHWSPTVIPVVDARIAVYSSGAKIWVAKTSRNACLLAREMAEKMRLYSEELPYTPPIAHRLSGLTLYLSLDKRTGSLHAFWCKNDQVLVWVELPRSQVEILAMLVREVG